MTTLNDLDRSMETVAQIADLLEAQMGKCPMSRMQLVTWVTNWFRNEPALQNAQRALPQLDQELRLDYAAWIHSVGKI